MKKMLFILIAVALVCFYVTLIAQEAAKTTEFKYIGVTKCKMCHRGEAKGMIFEKWDGSKHSKAYATLATDQAKEVAKKAGVAGDPQQAKACLCCHVTAYNAPANLKEASLTMEEGVSCEQCHGAGSAYKVISIKKEIVAGTKKAADYGLIIKPAKESCVTCHNPKSPTYKEFNFEKAAAAIEHHLPKAK
jgi:hypothetical protein